MTRNDITWLDLTFRKSVLLFSKIFEKFNHMYMYVLLTLLGPRIKAACLLLILFFF